MNLILSIPVQIARVLATVLFGTDEVPEAMKVERQKGMMLMLMGRIS